jgi:hypothetical protein
MMSWGNDKVSAYVEEGRLAAFLCCAVWLRALMKESGHFLCMTDVVGHLGIHNADSPHVEVTLEGYLHC